MTSEQKPKDSPPGPFTLRPLPWPEDALEPAISEQTIGFHYGKHHKKYVDTLNTLVEGTAYAEMKLEDVIVKTFPKAGKDAPDTQEKKIFNNAAQVWNHDFFWASLTPEKAALPGFLSKAIDRDFGGLDALKKALAKAGEEQFGSGWIWLVADEKGRLAVEKTPDAVTPMAQAEGRRKTCLLTIDVWEHAYYLDYQNRRPDFLRAVIDRALNWEFAARNLSPLQ